MREVLGRMGPVLGGVLVLALVAALAVVFLPGSGKRTLVADFPRTVSLYEGSDVRILGIPVGTVETVTPRGTVVRVEMTYDAEHDVPADAQAVIIAPSIVGDRFVQLTPAYEGGEVLEDGARLGIERTATPLELDEIFGSLNDLTVALGPEKSNRPVDGGAGPLTRLLDSTARNFGGQGVQFNQTIRDVADLSETLSDNEDELFGSLANVQEFTTTLAQNDGIVRRFNESLTAGSEVLAGEREELAAALRDLGVAMGEIRTFVRDNRDSLSTNIDGLKEVTDVLVARRAQLDEVLRTAPAALNNLYLTGNDNANTLDVRNDFSGLFDLLRRDPATAVCTLLGPSLPTKRCTELGGAVDDILEESAPAPSPLVGSAPRPGALAGAQPARHVTGEVDLTLGGLLAVQP